MDACIIACRTIEDELACAQGACGAELPVFWLESGLHNTPKKLRTRVQEAVDQAQEAGYGRLLLAMGFCGNSVEGVKLAGAQLVMPRADDCITLLLGSFLRRKALEAQGGTYFMTKGWIEGERNIWKEYRYAIDKYGEETGREIFEMMFGNYRRIGILDTRSYAMEPVERETDRIASALGLTWETFDASFDYLADLLTGPWENDRFLTVGPHAEIRASHLTVMEE